MPYQRDNIICITGDVHHRSLRTREAPYIDPKSEIELAQEYVRIAANYGLKVTLFVTGKALAEEWKDFEPMLNCKNVEFGAHTYSAFEPLWLHRIIKLFRGSYWISRAQQRRDIARAVDIFRLKLGGVQSWRTHSYEYDEFTPYLLTDYGVRIWSDMINKSLFQPSLMDGIKLVSLPINVREDHSGFYHGFLSREKIIKRQRSLIARFKKTLLRRNDREQTIADGSEWEAGFKFDVTNAAQHGVAVMNLHPVCMYLLDQFQTFDRLCAWLGKYESLLVSEVGEEFFL